MPVPDCESPILRLLRAVAQHLQIPMREATASLSDALGLTPE
jgi:hypothetical protein